MQSTALEQQHPARRLRTIGVLVLFFLSVTSVHPQSGWAKQRAGTMSWLYSVFFFDQNRGYAVGSRGTLLVTTDGGSTWKPKSASTKDLIRDIFFVDEHQGWLVVERNIYDLRLKDEPRSYLMPYDSARK